MLLNEFVKEHRKAEEQARLAQKQDAAIAQLQKQLTEVTAIVQNKQGEITTTAGRTAVCSE